MSKLTEAIHNHHQQLVREIGERAKAFATKPSEATGRALADFLRTELLPHAAGEEKHLYPLVGQLVKAHGDGTETMRVDHEFIRNYAEQIASAAKALGSQKDGERSASSANRIERLVTELQAIVRLHLEKEERVYLPMLEKHASAETQQRTLESIHEDYRESRQHAHSPAAPHH
jgi:hemerythrin-like domain-containing protein